MQNLPSRRHSRREPITLEARPVLEEELSAKDYLELVKSKPDLIKSSRAVMPEPGRAGFGGILVRYSRPVYKTS